MTSGHGAGSRAGAPQWWIYRGTGEQLDPAERDRRWPPPPRWRDFQGSPDQPPPPPDDPDVDRRLGTVTVAPSDSVNRHEVDLVNAAIYLRRPLLVTGNPGSGKSSLAYRIARELRLGRVLRWPITTRTALNAGLYEYDAIGRVQAAAQRRSAADRSGTGGDHDEEEPSIGEFVHLGPLGTALLPHRLPRVLLIDELDKSDIDLPNDLLNTFEDGTFSIPELVRVRNRYPEVPVHTADPGGTAVIRDGLVHCHAFPVVVITSNGEREFPPPFLRRCLQLTLADPDEDKLADMVTAHFPDSVDGSREMIREFLRKRDQVGGLAADQLLNAIALSTSGAFPAHQRESWDGLLDAIWHRLSQVGPG